MVMFTWVDRGFLPRLSGHITLLAELRVRQ
jgi:hypothetical protein